MVSSKAVGFFWIAALVMPGFVFGYAEGPDAGYSGVPGELGTCIECHTPSGARGTGSVTVAFANGLTYTPGVTQQVVVTVADPLQRRWGFQLTTRLANQSSSQAGGFTPGSDGYTQLVCVATNLDISFEVYGSGCTGSSTNPLQYIEHTSLGTRLGQTGSAAFTFTWTPPCTSVGNITVYVAGNAANGDGTDSGDHIYTNTFTLTPASGSCSPAPEISNVVDGATFLSNTGAPSTYMSIFGSNLATSTLDWGSSFVAGNAPTTLGGASVTVDGTPAYIAYASPGQINIVTPAISATGGGIPVIVNVGGQQSAVFSITMQSLTPYLFFWALPSPNTTKYLVAQHANPTIDIGSVGLFANNSPPTTPAKPGETIVLWGTGLGPTTAPPGTLASQNSPLSALPTATVGGIAATVTFAGIPAGYCELYQVDVTIPANAPNGDQAVVLNFSGTTSFSGLVTVHQ